MFAKHPDHVAVKTRLARTIGRDQAHQVAQILNQFLLRKLGGAPIYWEIVAWPPESIDSFRSEAGDAWKVVPQSDGDLGDRMSNWFHAAFGAGNQCAIAIGADCPFVETGHIQQAAKLLKEGNDLVLGPAEDGGYWLVGMSRRPDSLFSNIEWGTAHVLEATVRNAKAAGWKTAFLERLRDIDELDDLTIAIDQLSRSDDPELSELSKQLSTIVSVVKS